MLELEILLDQLCHSSIDVGKLVVAIHGIGISAGRLSVAVDSLGYSIDRSHIIRHGEEKEEAYQKKSCSDRHHSRDDTPVEAGIEVLGVGLEILVDQLMARAEAEERKRLEQEEWERQRMLRRAAKEKTQ